ncbi:MAG: tripartite tricarboxylate transporter substrate binding protein [Burkholderiales bacterium]
MNLFRTLALAAALAALPLAVAAQAFPSKPVKVIVPYPAGGVVDVIARSIGEPLSQSLGQPVVVENRVGAASNIGTEAVARSAPDGHTLIVASPAHAVNISLYPKLSWHPIKSFAPVAMVGVIPNVIVVHPSVPVQSLQELVAYAKARPGKLNYASAGAGSSVHLAAEMLKQMSGMFVVHIPYNGQPAAVTAIISGEVHMMPLTMALAKSRIQAGQLRGLAVTTPARSPAMPNLPTVAESGYPGFEVSTWFAYLAPAGTPADVVAKLNTQINAAMKNPAVAKRLTNVGAELKPGTPQDLQKYIEADIDRWAKVIKQAGIKLE